jgi:hypothetical protein
MLRVPSAAKARLSWGRRRERDTIRGVKNGPLRSAVPRGISALAGAVALTLGSGCAREALPPEVPGMPVAGASMDAQIPLPARHGGNRGALGRAIPDGEACLALLASEDVRFHELPPKPGMVTPVAVTGPIGGIRYESGGVTSIVCDCRLAVALDWLAPELRSFGIREIHHSGAYVYRTTRNGGPSLHALGLAIDLHRFRFGAQGLEVSKDYARGQGPSCEQDSPTLNRLACEVERTGLFQQVMTPDDDYDHRDHLHLAISPL